MKNICKIALFVIYGLVFMFIGWAIGNSPTYPDSFTLNGHEYVRFTDGVVHSPDCKKCDSIQNAKLDKLVSSLEIGED